MFLNALATAQQHCCGAVGGKRVRFVPFSGGTPILEVGVLYDRGALRIAPGYLCERAARRPGSNKGERAGAVIETRGWQTPVLPPTDRRRVSLSSDPLLVNTIAPKVWLTHGSISVAVDRLVEKGRVSRKDHPDDRRVRRVELTAKGQALITRGFREHAAAMETAVGVLSKNERLTLLRLLKKLGKHAAARRPVS